MTDEPRCRWNGPTSARVLPGRHGGEWMRRLRRLPRQLVRLLYLRHERQAAARYRAAVGWDDPDRAAKFRATTNRETR